MPIYENIDYRMLALQRARLVEMVAENQQDGNTDRVRVLEGILNLLDAITDTAIDSGYTTEEEATMEGED